MKLGVRAFIAGATEAFKDAVLGGRQDRANMGRLVIPLHHKPRAWWERRDDAEQAAFNDLWAKSAAMNPAGFRTPSGLTGKKHRQKRILTGANFNPKKMAREFRRQAIAAATAA